MDSHDPSKHHAHFHGSAPSVAVKDPVCGMTINPEKAAWHSEYGGQTLYFCSQSCQAKFDADPSRYAEAPEARLAPAPVAPSAAAKSEWTCPMHPEIVRDAPGSCPICGMA